MNATAPTTKKSDATATSGTMSAPVTGRIRLVFVVTDGPPTSARALRRNYRRSATSFRGTGTFTGGRYRPRDCRAVQSFGAGAVTRLPASVRNTRPTTRGAVGS